MSFPAFQLIWTVELVKRRELNNNNYNTHLLLLVFNSALTIKNTNSKYNSIDAQNFSIFMFLFMAKLLQVKLLQFCNKNSLTLVKLSIAKLWQLKLRQFCKNNRMININATLYCKTVATQVTTVLQGQKWFFYVLFFLQNYRN